MKPSLLLALPLPSLSSLVVHSNIICDQCHVTGIVGVRYKCAVCADFDLCDACWRACNVSSISSSSSGHISHPISHCFILIRTPLPHVPDYFQIAPLPFDHHDINNTPPLQSLSPLSYDARTLPIHPSIICDGCNIGIRGIRFKCAQCNDFDYCSKCYSGVHDHPSSHVFYALNYVIPSYYGMQTPNLYVAGESHPSLVSWHNGQPAHTATSILPAVATTSMVPTLIDDIWSLPVPSKRLYTNHDDHHIDDAAIKLSRLSSSLSSATSSSVVPSSVAIAPIITIRGYHASYLDGLVTLESECFGEQAWGRDALFNTIHAPHHYIAIAVISSHNDHHHHASSGSDHHHGIDDVKVVGYCCYRYKYHGDADSDDDRNNDYDDWQHGQILDDHVHVLSLCVSSLHRSRGIGELLMRRMIDAARSLPPLSLPSISLSCDDDDILTSSSVLSSHAASGEPLSLSSASSSSSSSSSLPSSLVSLSSSMDVAPLRRMSYITLHVRVDNPAAIRLYNRLKFDFTDIIPQYYSATTDAYLMRLLL